MTNTSSKIKSAAKSTVSKKEYDEMKKQLEEMKALMSQVLNSSAEEKKNNTVNNITNYIGDNTKDVFVTSLTVGELNLSTEGYGRGEIYTFSNIGEEQSIPLEDLKKIVKNNKKFIDGGNIFINDDEVVKSLKLNNIYKKLLSYDEMQELFKKDRDAFEKVFVGMTDNQKETLKRIIFEKLKENEKSVDMNIVQVINDVMDIDIMDDFKNSKKLSEFLKNDN